jgi:hypothetical protein
MLRSSPELGEPVAESPVRALRLALTINVHLRAPDGMQPTLFTVLPAESTD